MSPSFLGPLGPVSPPPWRSKKKKKKKNSCSNLRERGQHRYTITCSRLLGQYKTILKNPTVAAAFVDLDTFKREYDVCIARSH